MKKLIAFLLLAFIIFISSCSENSDSTLYELNETTEISESNQDGCDDIVIENAQSLKRLVTDYLNPNEESLVFRLDEDSRAPYVYRKVLDDKINTMVKIKKIFSTTVCDEYIKYLLSDKFFPAYKEENGSLYCAMSETAPIGTLESWYCGYDVDKDRIIGHFAALHDPLGIIEIDQDFINDIKNYTFYNIALRNENGNYMIERCYTDGNIPYDYSQVHGLFYDCGEIDKSLITNDKIKPKKCDFTMR